ncbi:hypothetical protein EBL87_19555 [Cereibacter sphaeroides]|uniref:hypothetical protein n=1 Tax=Cereibacter sphaeroides TaxID=1063 RepID=UPI000F528817|nr:hypothetical protein [Cereibacter sphaeroides]AZB65917.1 hypothetical protein EBL87_19555 [Cereibacter sphaeroides]AZB70676.1 hypothetical protein EBL86_20125 [Cereibacter sphaeroides]
MSEAHGSRDTRLALGGGGPPAGPAPTHLLTMARGVAEAIPQRLLPALRAMGITTCVLPGRGLGLTFEGPVPAFLSSDPFRLAELSLPEPVAEPPAPAEESPPEEPAPVEPEEPVDPEAACSSAEETPADEVEAGAPEPRAEDPEQPSLEAPEPESVPDAPSGAWAERLAAIETAVTAVTEALATQAQAQADLSAQGARLEQLVTALGNRPLPTLNLTAQHKSFAAFGTAMASFMSRMEAFLEREEQTRARFLSEVSDLLRSATGPASSDGSGSVELDAMSRALAAVTEELSQTRAAPQLGELMTTIGALTQYQERILALLMRHDEVPDTRMQAAQEQFLRDIRVVIAELLAENRRAALSGTTAGPGESLRRFQEG